MFRTSMPQKPELRRGVILLVVISLLTLFAIAGIAFVLYAQTHADESRIARETKTNPFNIPDTPPNVLFGEFLRQFVYDDDDSAPGTGIAPPGGVISALRGHSLARGIYGDNYDPTGTTLILNNQAYNGTGRLHTYPGTYMNPYNVDDYLLPNYQWFSADNFLRDSERLEIYGSATSRTSPLQPVSGPFTGGFNAPYTYPDLNTMCLAAVAADGTVLMPSYHRPWAGFGSLDPSNPNWYIPSSAIQQVPGGPTPPNPNAALKYMVLRPRPIDQLLPFETWDYTKNQPYNPTTNTWRTSFFPPPADAGGDVKNLLGSPGTLYPIPGTNPPQWNYANNDSSWMDIGSPVRTLPDGRKYKALYAPLIVDLDNRVNLNVHGNVLNTHFPNNPPPVPQHFSNQGWGPWAVDLQYVLNKMNSPGGTVAEWPNIFLGNPPSKLTGSLSAALLGRYGPDQQPSQSGTVALPGSLPHFYGQVDYDGCNELTNPITPSGPIYPPPQNGMVPWPSYTTPPPPGTYAGYGNGSPAERLNHPSLYNLFQPGGDDRSFDLSNLAALIRDGSSPLDPTTDLAQLCPVNFADPRIRRLVTTLSFDVDRPGMPPFIHDQATYPYGYANPPPYQATPDQAPTGTPIPFPLLSTRPASLNTNNGEFQGIDWRNLYAALGRVDLNRHLTPYPSYPIGTNPALVSYVSRYDDLAQAAVNAQFLQAQADRQQLAYDIFQRLVAVTGVAVPPPSTVNPPPSGTAGNPTDLQLITLRWLGQLAANIVDFIDDDDISTPFNYYYALYPNFIPLALGDKLSLQALLFAFPDLASQVNTMSLAPPGSVGPIAQIDPTKPTRFWVFGTELPHVVLNEVLGEYQALPGAVKLYAELYNPFQGIGSNVPDIDTVPLYMPPTTSGNSASNAINAAFPYAPYQLMIVAQPPPPAVPPNQSLNPTISPPGNHNVVGDPDPNTVWPGSMQGPPAGYSTSVLAATSVADFAKPAVLVGPPAGTPQPPQPLQPAANLWAAVPQVNSPHIPPANSAANTGTTPFFLITAQGNTANNAIPGPPTAGPATAIVPANTPWLQTTNLLFTANIGATGGLVATDTSGVQVSLAANQVMLLLRRLANPHIPWNPNPITTVNGQVVPNRWYNPYLTVDYMEQVQLNDTTKAGDQAQGKLQPYAAEPTSWIKGQNVTGTITPTPIPVGQTFDTFGQLNNPVPPPLPPPSTGTPPPGTYDWLTFLDRQLISPMEILNVPGVQPYQLTHYFKLPLPASTTNFGHLVPWTDPTRRLYRAMEFLETHNRAAGMSGDPLLPESVNIRRQRLAGKINLNTIFDQINNLTINNNLVLSETFWALCDPKPNAQPGLDFNSPSGLTDLATIFTNMMKGRTLQTVNLVNAQGQNMTYYIPGPTNVPPPGTAPYISTVDMPFWSLAAPFSPNTPGGATNTDLQYPNGFGINNTLFRPANPALPLSATNLPLFLPPSVAAANAPPYWQNQLLTKIYNHVTTRSNVFALYLTVGFFEVIQDTDPVTGNPIFPVKLGAEINLTQGTNVRHHMFAIVDRSALTIRPPITNQQLPNATTANQPQAILTQGVTTVTPAAMIDPNANLTANPPIPPQWSIRPGTIVTVDEVFPGTNIYGYNPETVVVTGIDLVNNPPQWFTAKFNKPHNQPMQAPLRIVIPDLGNPGPVTTWPPPSPLPPPLPPALMAPLLDEVRQFQPRDDSAVVPYYVVID